MRNLALGSLFCVWSSAAFSEQFQFGVLPQTGEPRVGNNLTIVSEIGERFEGRAWRNGPNGYFCFSGTQTSCGGRYDSRSIAEELNFTFLCLDSRQGTGTTIRSATQTTASALMASGEFSSGETFVATFGPDKVFEEGVGCWVSQ